MEIFSGHSRLVINSKRGGAIDELVLKGVQVIEFQENVHYQASLLFPFPNRLKKGSYNFEGKRYSFPHNDIKLPNALHGMVHNKEFIIVEQSDSMAQLKFCYKGEEAYYPFPFNLFITYQLKETALDIAFEAINTGSCNLPCGFGWHPYFYTAKYENAQIKLPRLNQVEIDQLMIPIGRKSPFYTFDTYESVSKHTLDSCFKLKKLGATNSSYLKPSNVNQIEIWQDENFKFLQVFTPQEKTSVAIEPMTCNIDAFNNRDGLKVLAPDEKWRISFGVKLRQ